MHDGSTLLAPEIKDSAQLSMTWLSHNRIVLHTTYSQPASQPWLSISISKLSVKYKSSVS